MTEVEVAAAVEITNDSDKSTKAMTSQDVLVSAAIIMTQLVQVGAVPCQRSHRILGACLLADTEQMIPYGAGINGGLEIGRILGATPAESTWIVASYP